MLKISYADCAGLSPVISAQFTLKMCVTTGSRKKITKNFYLVNSRNVDTNKKLVTITCYDKQHVCVYLQPFLRYTR